MLKTTRTSDDDEEVKSDDEHYVEFDRAELLRRPRSDSGFLLSRMGRRNINFISFQNVNVSNGSHFVLIQLLSLLRVGCT